MGMSLTGIHVFGTAAPEDAELPFRSFSAGWFTCVNDFSETDPERTYEAARRISRATDAPVLYFNVFDSEAIWFVFFRGGKVAAKYSDDEFSANKGLYGIPALVGYESGGKRRLSDILSCADTERKIALLEEYFGVCLTFVPEMLDEPEALCRERSERLYRAYREEEKLLTGKSAPMALRLAAEYPGKLFFYRFQDERITVKPHFFLHGYAGDPDEDERHRILTPVHFAHGALEPSDWETFAKGRIPRCPDTRFVLQCGTPVRVTFSGECPPEYRGRTMALPAGAYPEAFLPTGELLILGEHRIYVVEPATLKIVAKLPHKGDVADVVGNYILTTAGSSFYCYGYDPKSKIYIYELIHR